MASSGQRQRLYPPLLTLKAMLFQALDGGSCCRKALCFIQQIGKKKLHLGTAAFCRARKRIPLELLTKMLKEAGEKVSEKKGKLFIWIDGFIVNTQDSVELREKYPHTKAQKLGLGQPIIRVLGAFCASTGSLLDFELSKFVGKGQAEPSVLLRILGRFKKGSVLVMDRFFTSGILLELICQIGLDFVARGRQAQLAKLFKKGEQEVLVKLKDCYAQNRKISERKIKVAKVTVQQKGFRPKVIYVMSSLVKYSGHKLTEIYRQRWNVEVAIRHIKVTLGLKLIAAKSEAVALRIMAVTFLAYNLTVSLLAKAKLWNAKTGQVSFKTATYLLLQKVLCLRRQTYRLVVELLAAIKFKSRYRREPRAIKRRSNKYPHLTVERSQSSSQVWGYHRREGKAVFYA